MKRFWRLEGGRYWPETADPEMSALAPLLGDKQTSGEQVPNDAIDPKPTCVDLDQQQPAAFCCRPSKVRLVILDLAPT